MSTRSSRAPAGTGAIRRRVEGTLAGAVLLAAVGCVKIDTAPGGIASVQLQPAPPAIALGDSLRDTVGAVVRVQGTAYAVGGGTVATAEFRYGYVPLIPDTTAGAVIDTALVVDSATGAVRATRSWIRASGRVIARTGSLVQLADTLQIVAPPDSLIAAPNSTTGITLDTLRFDCTDPRLTVVQRATTDSVGTFVNTVGPFTLLVRGDSAGIRVGVRRWFVRWSLDTLPAPVPTVTLSTGRMVPAIGIVTNTADQYVRYDTTDASGNSSVRLRIQPPGLGKTYSPDTLVAVTLRADVIRGAGVPVNGSPARGVFRVLLSRRGVPPAGSSQGITCQR